MTKIGLGVLLGLYDFRYDALAVIEHGNYLRRTYGIGPHALGIPRLKPARGVLASQKPNRFTVSDDDFRLVISVYHLAFPTSRLFFNTRESYDLKFRWWLPVISLPWIVKRCRAPTCAGTCPASFPLTTIRRAGRWLQLSRGVVLLANTSRKRRRTMP